MTNEFFSAACIRRPGQDPGRGGGNPPHRPELQHWTTALSGPMARSASSTAGGSHARCAQRPGDPDGGHGQDVTEQRSRSGRCNVKQAQLLEAMRITHLAYSGYDVSGIYSPSRPVLLAAAHDGRAGRWLQPCPRRSMPGAFSIRRMRPLSEGDSESPGHDRSPISRDAGPPHHLCGRGERPHGCHLRIAKDAAGRTVRDIRGQYGHHRGEAGRGGPAGERIPDARDL